MYVIRFFRILPPPPQHGAAVFRFFALGPLDVPEPTDALRQGEQFGGERQPLGGELAQHAVDVAFEFGDEGALPAPFLGACERVERCAAHVLHLREQREGVAHGRTVFALGNEAGDGVGAGEERRGEVEAHLEGAFERLLQLLPE